MKKLMTQNIVRGIPCGLLALTLSATGVQAQDENGGATVKTQSEQKAKPIIILDSNVTQTGRWIADGAYQGDRELREALKTVETRLRMLFVNSGRVEVKSQLSATKTVTDPNTYKCGFELLQGRKITGSKRGNMEEYIIELGIETWNFKDDTPLPELTRGVRIQGFFQTPEDAMAFVMRYLAVFALGVISPVTVTEKEGSDFAVNAGDQLLNVGDKLQIKKGLRKSDITLTVVETDFAKSVCTIDKPVNTDAVSIGDIVILQAPEPPPVNPCKICNGTGKTDCPRCKRGFNLVEQTVMCDSCNGTGIKVPSVRVGPVVTPPIPCGDCVRGQKRITKQVPCQQGNCNNGKIPCTTCNGKGTARE